MPPLPHAHSQAVDGVVIVTGVFADVDVGHMGNLDVVVDLELFEGQKRMGEKGLGRVHVLKKRPWRS